MILKLEDAKGMELCSWQIILGTDAPAYAHPENFYIDDMQKGDCDLNDEILQEAKLSQLEGYE